MQLCVSFDVLPLQRARKTTMQSQNTHKFVKKMFLYIQKVTTRKAILRSGVQKVNKNRFKIIIIMMKVCSSDLPRRQQAKKC